MLSLQVDWMSSPLYSRKLTTFQQLDFTNGKTASVFLQLHIWLSLSLRRAEAGSPREHDPPEPRGPRVLLGCEGHRLPGQLEARTSSAHAKHPSQRQVVGEKCRNVCLGLLRLSCWCGDFRASTARHDCSRTLENVSLSSTEREGTSDNLQAEWCVQMKKGNRASLLELNKMHLFFLRGA